MTDEQINIAIAEACGWTDCEHVEALGLCKGKHENALPQYLTGHSQLPDYCTDLNAMREAEQKLWSMNWELRCEFIHQLAKLIKPRYGYQMLALDALDVTSRQRAEALLKTIGKWGKPNEAD